jgi:hypothetical protein
MPTFEILVAIVAALAGAVASVAGFGIGSLLTPLLALRAGMRLAVALVSVPHLAGTLLRFWQLKGQVDRRVFVGFGLTSAAGGLAGAVLHLWVTSRVLPPRRESNKSTPRDIRLVRTTCPLGEGGQHGGGRFRTRWQAACGGE